MIYDRTARDFQVGIFAFDVDDKFFSWFGKDWQTTQGAEGWLRHNKPRVYLRLWTFIDSVLERHNSGQRGFRDPVIIYGDLEKQHFNVHPGTNRIVLKKLLPEVRLVGWVVDPRCTNRSQYKPYFNNIQPIARDKQGNNQILWQAHHRSGRGKGVQDVYDFSLTSDIYLGADTYDTPKRKLEWQKIRKTTGFSVYVNNKYFYDIGTPQGNHAYEIKTVEGVYQLFLHYFFGYPLTKWKTHYFRKKI